MSTTPCTSTPPPNFPPPANRHAPTVVERQRAQLERLLRDPSKPAPVPSPPKDKTIRPPREMMKNVQGSSAGAGSGEFHVYKASRRREYERLKIMEEETQKEQVTAEFEQKRRNAEELADAKTARNRAKRQKKKERAKAKGQANNDASGTADVGGGQEGAPLKKRRIVNGQALVFRHPGEMSGSEDDEPEGHGPDQSMSVTCSLPTSTAPETTIAYNEESEGPMATDTSRVTIYDD